MRLRDDPSSNKTLLFQAEAALKSAKNFLEQIHQTLDENFELNRYVDKYFKLTKFFVDTFLNALKASLDQTNKDKFTKEQEQLILELYEKLDSYLNLLRK